MAYGRFLGRYIMIKGFRVFRKTVEIQFYNGDVVTMKKSDLIKAGNNTRWSQAYVYGASHVIVIPNKPFAIMVSATSIRFHTDRAFRKFWRDHCRRGGYSWRENTHLPANEEYRERIGNRTEQLQIRYRNKRGVPLGI